MNCLLQALKVQKARYTPLIVLPLLVGEGWREATGEGQPRFSVPQCQRQDA